MSSAEHHPIRRNLWQRWMSWSGSFLVLSILVHMILIGGATVLIVQVVQGRKEKLKFTAAPPTASAPAEHRVKPTKKTSAAAPAVSKRITSTAINVSVALPAMDLNASTSPDLMAGVMSGMSASGLGAGAGAGAGMASMPLTGLTAFGFKGKGNLGLKGFLYDTKLTRDGRPAPGGGEGQLKDAVMGFLKSGWNEGELVKYNQAKEPLSAVQFAIPVMLSEEAPRAFKVEKEIKPQNWFALYKGTVVAARSTTFRFRGRGDNFLAVNFDGKSVFFNSLQDIVPLDLFPENQPQDRGDRAMLNYGAWITVEKGRHYPIQVLIADYGERCSFVLALEEKQPDKPYPVLSGKTPTTVYPLFQLKKDAPIPIHKKSMNLTEKDSLPDVSTDQNIFVF